MLTLSIHMTPEHPQAEFDKFLKYFPNRLQEVHMGAVLYILEECFQWSRVDTGRFRGGWIGLMRMMNYPYQRSESYTAKFSSTEEAEGAASSQVINGPLMTYVQNGVQYGGYLEDRSGIFDQAGKESFRPSPYRGLLDATTHFQMKYAAIMEEAFKSLQKRFDSGDYDVQPFEDFGPPDPGGA